MNEGTGNASHSNTLADATETVAHQLGQCRQFADYYIARAWCDRPPGESADYSYLEQAQKMMRLTAELAGTLARLKGEVRQHIVVEHIEAPASPALIGEASIAAPFSVGGEGGGVDSGKRVVAAEANDAATS